MKFIFTRKALILSCTYFVKAIILRMTPATARPCIHINFLNFCCNQKLQHWDPLFFVKLQVSKLTFADLKRSISIGIAKSLSSYGSSSGSMIPRSKSGMANMSSLNVPMTILNREKSFDNSKYQTHNLYFVLVQYHEGTRS